MTILNLFISALSSRISLTFGSYTSTLYDAQDENVQDEKVFTITSLTTGLLTMFLALLA